MEKEITFTGLNLTPYSDISPDGQLSAAQGIERHAGSIRPVVLNGKELFAELLTEADVLTYIHTTSSYKHYFFLRTNSEDQSKVLWYASEEEPVMHEIELEISSGINKITSLGNTIILLFDTGVHYMLYKNQSYQSLGQKPPELDMIFGFNGTVRIGGDNTINIDTNDRTLTGGVIFFSDETKQQITNQVVPIINAFIQEQTNDGKFIFPFFIRYAYRTYSGHYMASPPVLIKPNDGRWPQMEARFSTTSVVIDVFTTAITSCVGTPFYKIEGFADKYEKLQNWKDIIESVDIFISAPIYSYNPDGKCGDIENASFGHPIFSWAAGKRLIENAGRYYTTTPNTYNYELITPHVAKEEYYNKIKQNSIFYKALSIPISDLTESLGTDGTPIFESEIVKNITTQDTLNDTGIYDHDKLKAKQAYIYNQRLNIANLERTPYMFPVAAMTPFTNGVDDNLLYTYTPYVFIESNGDSIVIKGEPSLFDEEPYHLYYPNVKAKKIVLKKHSDTLSSTTYAEYPLIEHPFLNGAYYYNCGAIPTFKSDYDESLLTSEYNFIAEPNKLFLSEVNNPFFFPLNGINTIGTGEIIGLATITTALSQGQHGQFPLMLFCTDGNYTLQVNSEGLYAGTPPPMQRDVCINPASITQIEGQVIFVSSRGAMTADGSVISCISEALNGVPDPFVTGLNTIPQTLFETCFVAYDYAGRRMIFFAADKAESYILSLEDGTWSTGTFNQCIAVHNIYPYSYIQFAGENKILCLNDNYQFAADSAAHAGLIITRPLKLDSLQLKRLHQIKLEGLFASPQTIKIYGSQNATDWHLIGSTNRTRVGAMCGRYFKYYRFEIITSLTEAENISGLRIEYDIRTERRMR